MGNCKCKDYFENLEPGKPDDRWCDPWRFADDGNKIVVERDTLFLGKKLTPDISTYRNV
jgi:hypothetical protein